MAEWVVIGRMDIPFQPLKTLPVGFNNILLPIIILLEMLTSFFCMNYSFTCKNLHSSFVSSILLTGAKAFLFVPNYFLLPEYIFLIL